jgi:FkbM family methyltransferase
MREADDNLLAQIERSPLLRRVATAADLSKPSALCCFARERATALAWFREQTGRAPERVFALDGAVRPWKPLSVREREPALQLVLFGERLRAKATRLSAQGHEQLLFAADPKLAATRTAPDYLERHREQLELLWQSLADAESRLVLASILRQRLTGDCGYLRVARYPEYCHPQVLAEPGDVVVDAGAFNGATSAAFARSVGLRGMVYAFEPSQKNRQLIRRRLRLPWNWLLRVQVQPQALSDAVGSGQFEEGRGGSGKLTNAAGSQLTELTTLDEFASKSRKLDLVSLDVEGSEPAVLAGAQSVIERQRPKLQISVYHSLTHLFELPLQLLERYPDYALFLGHHDVYSTETDAYLVPRERLQPL